MRNKLIVFIFISFILASCSDWNEIESIDIKQPNIAEQNPELYAKYLEDLKAYKKSAHKVAYVWFNNSQKLAAGQSQRIATLPDSIDVVSLIAPDNLADWELAEIETLRKDKGTKVVFTLDFDAIKGIFDEKLAEILAENEQNEDKANEIEIPDFINFLVDTVNHSLALVRKYNYDGISMAYKGKSILHMTESEKRIHTTYEKAFMGIANDWQERNNDKMICYEGYPQNLLDKSFLDACTYIIIPCGNVKSVSELDYNIIMASVENVPTDRFIVAVSAISLDEADDKTGYWSNGTRATLGTANWITASNSSTPVIGIGIYNVNNDYFNPTLVYQHTRRAINIMNPSPKIK